MRKTVNEDSFFARFSNQMLISLWNYLFDLVNDVLFIINKHRCKEINIENKRKYIRKRKAKTTMFNLFVSVVVAVVVDEE